MDGARLGLRQNGSGALALFVHGFTLDSRMWLNQLEDLADVRWCVAVDLRGRGGSDRAVETPHTPQAVADDLAALITALGGHLADLVGFSMGGYATLALMDRHPKLVRSVTLVGSKATADSAETRAARDRAVADIRADRGAGFADGFLPRLISSSADAQTADAVRTMIEETPPDTLIADLLGMRDRPDRTAVLDSWRGPVLAIVGEEDVLTPPADSHRIGSLAGDGRVLVVPGSGHMVPMEAPHALNAALRGFWRSPAP